MEQGLDQVPHLILSSEASRPAGQAGRASRRFGFAFLFPGGGGEGAEAAHERAEILVPWTVGDGEQSLPTVLFPQLVELTLPTEPVVPGLRTLECLSGPGEKSLEIGVVETVSASDEEKGAEGLDGLKDSLRVLVTSDVLVGADTQDH